MTFLHRHANQKQISEEAYRLFFRRYYPRLYCYAKRMVGAMGAEEVTQDVFMDIWKRFGEIEVGNNILGYLYRAVYRRSLNYLRDNGRNDTQSLEDINEMRAEYYISDIGNGEKNMADQDLQRQINQAISELPDKCRETFVLSYIHGLKNKEIADAQGVSQRTVDAQIYKALKYLRERLGNILP